MAHPTGDSRRPVKAVVLDMDSSVSPTYGDQEGTAYNGHFACTFYHPLFAFNQFGDLERCALRPGNVHSAHGFNRFTPPCQRQNAPRTQRKRLVGCSVWRRWLGRPTGGRLFVAPVSEQLHLTTCKKSQNLSAPSNF
jgi:hypothetical protein